jgi:adenylate cyclase
MAWVHHPRTAGVVSLLVVVVVLVGLRLSSALEGLELLAYDEFVRLRASGAGVDNRVAEITITEDDLQRFNWPLSDGKLAEIVDRLRAAKVRALGIDLFRPSPIGPGTEDLDRAIRETPQLVWVNRFSQDNWQGIPAPAAATATGRTGFADLVLDRSGYTRRGLLYLNDDKHAEESLSLKLALLYLASRGITPTPDAQQWLRLGTISLPALDPDYGGYVGVDARGYQILREFRTPPRVTTFNLSALLDGTIPPDALADRIVVVGVDADSVKDFVMTPFDTEAGRGTPGATVQALFAAQLLQHGLDGLIPTHPFPHWIEIGMIVAATLFGGIAAIFLRRGIYLLIVVILGLAALIGGAYIAFLHSLWLPVVPMTIGWILARILTTLAIANAESAQRTHLMSLFSSYVSEPIARQIWMQRNELTSDGRPIPLRLTATILFSDINDFTTISEALDADKVVQWLDPYMERMTHLVDEYSGIVDRFIGDGILAMWGVPIARHSADDIAADAVAATRCAIRMRADLDELNRLYREENLPEMRVAIGIYSGELVGCTLGNSSRQQYTTIGDTTNTAARLVNVAKDVMKAPETESTFQVVVGASTQALIGNHFVGRPLGSFALKGKSQLVECFTVDAESGAASVPGR